MTRQELINAVEAEFAAQQANPQTKPPTQTGDATIAVDLYESATGTGYFVTGTATIDGVEYRVVRASSSDSPVPSVTPESDDERKRREAQQRAQSARVRAALGKIKEAMPPAMRAKLYANGIQAAFDWEDWEAIRLLIDAYQPADEVETAVKTQAMALFAAKRRIQNS
jgi:hypothetical protein